MENSLITKEKNGSVATLADMASKIPKLEMFTQKLNEAPKPEEIKINKAAKNSQYLPISFIRMKLDEVFAGLWNFEMIRETVVANEIIGVGVLEVFHPVANMWIRRSGAAAVMIQQVSKENGGSGRISNIDDKIKNTLVKDFPHLESQVLKSAAKKLGKMFGGDLNRQFEDNYSPIYTEEITGTEGLQIALDAMAKATIPADLQAVWNDNASLHQNADFQKNYMYYNRKIKK